MEENVWRMGEAVSEGPMYLGRWHSKLGKHLPDNDQHLLAFFDKIEQVCAEYHLSISHETAMERS